MVMSAKIKKISLPFNRNVPRKYRSMNVKIGFLEMTGIRPGEFRHLTPREVARFKKMLKIEDGAADDHS